MNKSYLGRTDLYPGLRNNNPGNLVKTAIDWNGKIPHSQNTDSRFEQFYELRYGLRAMMIDIRTDMLKGLNTINSLVSEYAPSFENDTKSYINQVSQAVGIAPSAVLKTLTKELLIAIVKAKVRVENGSQSNMITNDDYENAYAILNRDMPVELPSVKKKGIC